MFCLSIFLLVSKFKMYFGQGHKNTRISKSSAQDIPKTKFCAPSANYDDIRVSIIIPTRNRFRQICRTLQSLLNGYWVSIP